MTSPKIPVSTNYAAPTGYSPYFPALNAASSGTLQLDKTAAQQAASAAGAMLNVIYGVQGYVYAAQNISGFGGLPSSSRIADKFNTAATQLGDVINGHIKILNDLGQTLVIAGNLYQNHEHDSQAMFNNIVGDSEANLYDTPLHQMSAPATNANPQPAWAKDGSAPPDFTRADGYGSLLTVHNSSTGKNTMPVDPENPYHYVNDLGFFYGVHYAIDPQPAAFASADWDYMTKQMTAGAAMLVQSITALNTGGAWIGSGATNAVGAGKAYAGTVTNLVNNMDVIRTNLDYASGWLTSTKAALTPLPGQLLRQFTPTERTQMADALAKSFQNNYVVGISNSSSAVPMLTSPMLPAPPNYVSSTANPGTSGTGTIPTGSVGNPHNGAGGGIGGGGGGGGSGSGGGTGGGSGGGGGSGSGSGGGPGTGGGGGTGSGSGGSGSGSGGVGSGSGVGSGTGTGAGSGSAVPVGGLGAMSGQGADEYSPQARAALNAEQAAEEAEQAGSEAMAMEDGMANEAAVAARLAGAAGAEAEALAQDLRLFPRAALAAESAAEAEAAALGRAGAAGEGEGPGPMAGKRDEEEEEDEYKRADYLSSKKYLDEAIGTGVGVAKPVLTL